MNYIKSVERLQDLPSILEKASSRNRKCTWIVGKSEIELNSIRHKGKFVEINDKIYLFGNTFDQSELYKHVKTKAQLDEFLKFFTRITDEVVSGKRFDINVFDIGKILSKKNTIERYLSEEKVKPDLQVHADEVFEVKIASDYSEIVIEQGVTIRNLDSYDIRSIIKAELLHSLYIVQISRHRKLDIRNMMIVLNQLDHRKVINVLDITGNDELMSVKLYTPRNLIPKIFGIKTADRMQEVKIQELTDFFE